MLTNAIRNGTIARPSEKTLREWIAEGTILMVRADRQAQAKPLAEALKSWFATELDRVSQKSVQNRLQYWL